MAVVYHQRPNQPKQRTYNIQTHTIQSATENDDNDVMINDDNIMFIANYTITAIIFLIFFFATRTLTPRQQLDQIIVCFYQIFHNNIYFCDFSFFFAPSLYSNALAFLQSSTIHDSLVIYLSHFLKIFLASNDYFIKIFRRMTGSSQVSWRYTHRLLAHFIFPREQSEIQQRLSKKEKKTV